MRFRGELVVHARGSFAAKPGPAVRLTRRLHTDFPAADNYVQQQARLQSDSALPSLLSHAMQSRSWALLRTSDVGTTILDDLFSACSKYMLNVEYPVTDRTRSQEAKFRSVIMQWQPELNRVCSSHTSGRDLFASTAHGLESR